MAKLGIICSPTIMHKFLGIQLSGDLKMREHVNYISQCCNKMMYILCTLKHHGLNSISFQDICNATIISRMLYAVNSWWPLLNNEEINRLDKILRHAHGLGYHPEKLKFSQLADHRAKDLLHNIISNRNNILYCLLPPVPTHTYTLCNTNPNFSLPPIEGTHNTRNFMIHMLYKQYNLK